MKTNKKLKWNMINAFKNIKKNSKQNNIENLRRYVIVSSL